MSPGSVRLYHYTADQPTHLGSILGEGILRVTESNISRTHRHAGPDVVWLTTSPNPAGHGLTINHRGFDPDAKRAIRITVEVPKREVHRWRDWARARGIAPRWMQTLIEASGGGSSSWRVVARPIPRSEWVEIRDLRTDTVLWSAAGAEAA